MLDDISPVRTSVPIRRIEPKVDSVIPEFSSWTGEDGKTYVPQAYTGFASQDWALNQMQELVVPVVMHDRNLILQAKTSAGKTTAIVMKGSKHLRAGGRVLYLSPIKALASEKLSDWSKYTHPWSTFGVIEVSGDYKLTEAREESLRRSKVICATPESVLSLVTKSSRRDLLHGVSLIVVDEFHTLASPDRGPVLEFTLMFLASYLPNAEIMCPSATVENIQQCADWLTNLNGKKTDVVASDFRPVPLETEVIGYEGNCNRRSEFAREEEVVSIVSRHPNARGIIAFWKKEFLRDVAARLRQEGYEVVEHHTGIPKAQREESVRRFRDGDAQIMLCTTGYLVGVDSPAEYVIITATEAGGEPIPLYEIQQAIGRAGRQGYCDRGFAYVLAPECDAYEVAELLTHGCKIMSALTPRSLSVLMLLVVYSGAATNVQGVKNLYKSTLHNIQFTDDGAVLADVLPYLVKCRAVMQDDRGNLTITTFGRICAQLLIAPAQAIDLVRIVNMYRAGRENDVVWATAVFSATSESKSGDEPVRFSGGPLASMMEQFMSEFQKSNGGRTPNGVGMIRTYEILRKLTNQERNFYSSVAEAAQKDVPRYWNLLLRLRQESRIGEDIPLTTMLCMAAYAAHGTAVDTTKSWIETVTPARALAYAQYGLLGPDGVKSDPYLAEQVMRSL